MPFTPGHRLSVGKGRPKKGLTLTDALRASMAQKILVEDKDGTPLFKTKREVLLEKLFDFAIAGQAYAMQLIWERLDGKLAPTAEDATSDAAQVASAMMRTILDRKAKERERITVTAGAIPDAADPPNAVTTG
jgi:hypothetical protein